MLTEADKKIIARDSELPGLQALLDADLLLAKLKLLPNLSEAVAVEVQYLRYKPSNSCACTLCIKLVDGSKRYYYAKALTQSRFKESWTRPSRQKLVKEGGEFAPLAIADLYIMMLHPAHDREIGNLKWLIDEKHRNRLFKACSLPKIPSAELGVDILRYKPERRLVARVSQNGIPLGILRSASPDEFTKMLMGNTFGVAQGGVQLMGADGSSCTLITHWQKGYSLCPEEGKLPNTELTKKLAKKLSRIHSAPYKHPTQYTIADEIKSLKGVVNTFKYVLPEQTAWFERLVTRVEAGLNAQPDNWALIHGDFSLDQVIQRTSKSDEVKLHVLDWDRAAYGNPLLDLATFQARLELQVIEGVLPRWQADEVLKTFIHSYKKNSKRDITGLYWFVASALLRLGTEPFRKRGMLWEEYTLQLMQRVETLLAKGDALYVKPSKSTNVFTEEPALETLTSVEKMQTILHEEFGLGANEIIESATLRRYKVKRRALVDYKISTSNGSQYVIGKYRAKGLDKRSYHVQKTLWKVGFNSNAKVSVPEVIGKLPELNTWFQRCVNGQNFEDILLPTNERLGYLGEAVANAIHTLHQSHVAQDLDLPKWLEANELEILQDRLNQAQEILPQWAVRIAKVLANCEKIAKKLENQPLVSVHRDFYQDQVLEIHSKPAHIVLLDLDLLCQGHAALDAGNYLAHIKEFALRNYANEGALQTHEAGFKAEFLAQSGVSEEAVEIYTTLSLARHIYISTLFEDRKHTTEALLQLCEARLASHLNF